jgi:hypothetical protein
VSDQSRRNFLRNASISTAAVGIAAVPFVGASGASAAESELSGPTHGEAFAVWVADARTGDVAILAGERELIHRDPALARRLATLAVAPAQTK